MPRARPLLLAETAGRQDASRPESSPLPPRPGPSNTVGVLDHSPLFRQPPTLCPGHHASPSSTVVLQARCAARKWLSARKCQATARGRSGSREPSRTTVSRRSSALQPGAPSPLGRRCRSDACQARKNMTTKAGARWPWRPWDRQFDSTSGSKGQPQAYVSVQVSYKPEGCDTSERRCYLEAQASCTELAGEQQASLGGSVARVCPPRAAASEASRECLELAGRSR